MRTIIKNRKGQKIAILTDIAADSKSLAFVMHGLGGFKEQPHITTLSTVLVEEGYSVVRFDTTNSFGESEGSYEDATVTNYYEDLEDVISWSRSQQWYQEPFVLVGHSLGAMAVALYAEKYHDHVKALAPLSAVISGELSMKVPKYSSGDLKKWEETGWYTRPRKSKPGKVKRLKWSHMEDRLKYDLLPKAHVLTMPVLMVVSSDDESTPPEHQRKLFDVLPATRELHIIPGSDHSFTDEKGRTQLRSIFQSWVKSLG
jgi:pimeloyl-ACP methyl ester carboxylesterase